MIAIAAVMLSASDAFSTSRTLAAATFSTAVGVAIAAEVFRARFRRRHGRSTARVALSGLRQAPVALGTEKPSEQTCVDRQDNRNMLRLLATASHEIRTPLNAVVGLTDVLLEETLTPSQRRMAEAIRDSGHSLLQIVNDILDFAKADAGKVTFESLPFSPSDLARSVISSMEAAATAKGLRLSVDVDRRLPAALAGDACRIRQVLLNLVSNAVKFTDQGSVMLSVREAGRFGDLVRVEWTVRDTGIGTAPERIGSLFAEYAQADASISRRYGGTGLGLAICKRLVDQMGGEIAAESESGRGSIFRVRLDLPVADASLLGPAKRIETMRVLEARLAALRRTLRILVAEDDPTNRFVILQVLKRLNIKVETVSDGAQAVEAASRSAFDLIFMDMRMPVMDGLAATRQIRRDGSASAQAPIIALTANAFPEHTQACLDAGMSDFVSKPVNREALLRAILGALTGSKPAAGPVTTANPAPVIDAAAFEEMTAEFGADGVAELLETFKRDNRARLQRIAGDMSLSARLREIHSLKGAAGMVGARRLASLAAGMEQRMKGDEQFGEGDTTALSEAFEAFLCETEALSYAGSTLG